MNPTKERLAAAQALNVLREFRMTVPLVGARHDDIDRAVASLLQAFPHLDSLIYIARDGA